MVPQHRVGLHRREDRERIGQAGAFDDQPAEGAAPTPRSRLECRSLIAADSSPRMVQHRQPDCSSTMVSSMRSSRW